MTLRALIPAGRSVRVFESARAWHGCAREITADPDGITARHRNLASGTGLLIVGHRRTASRMTTTNKCRHGYARAVTRSGTKTQARPHDREHTGRHDNPTLLSIPCARVPFAHVRPHLAAFPSIRSATPTPFRAGIRPFGNQAGTFRHDPPFQRVRRIYRPSLNIAHRALRARCAASCRTSAEGGTTFCRRCWPIHLPCDRSPQGEPDTPGPRAPRRTLAATE